MYVLGDTTLLMDYYKVLKYLKYKESIIVALKIKQVFEDPYYLLPLAKCYQKGIGCENS